MLSCKSWRNLHSLPRPGDRDAFAWHHEALVLPWRGRKNNAPPHSADTRFNPGMKIFSRPMLPALNGSGPPGCITRIFATKYLPKRPLNLKESPSACQKKTISIPFEKFYLRSGGKGEGRIFSFYRIPDSLNLIRH